MASEGVRPSGSPADASSPSRTKCQEEETKELQADQDDGERCSSAPECTMRQFSRSRSNDSGWMDSIPGRFADLRITTRGCCSTKFAAQTSSCTTVCSTVDSQTGNCVTLERLANPFSRLDMAVRLHAEIVLLMHMRHENIVGLVDCFGDALTCSLAETPDNGITGAGGYLHIVTSRCPNACTLQTIIRTETLSEEHVRFITYQILRGLKYLHSAKIVHGDLKPSNIVIDEDCQLMIADLGIRQHFSHSTASTPLQPASTSVFQDGFSPQTSRQQVIRSDSLSSDSGPPRTPLEFSHVFSSMELKAAADVWAVGCIMAELITCRPLFQGTDNITQLVQILLLANHSPADILDRLPGDESVRQHADGILYLNPRSRPFKEVFSGADESAIGLLQQLLAVNHSERISVQGALEHSYMADFHDPDDEPTTVEFAAERLAKTCSLLQTPSDVQAALRDAVHSWQEQKLKRVRQDEDGPCIGSPPLKRVQSVTSDAANLTVVLSE